jgi:hypothetical protein
LAVNDIMTPVRKSSGSVLMLVLLITAGFLLLAIAGLTINSFLFQRNRSQEKADSLCLALACKLNAGDRIAQLNHLQAESRELVYLSRQRLEECNQEDLTFIKPLSDELLNEALEGNALLETEKQKQIQLISLELQQEAVNQNREAHNQNPFKLAWLETDAPQIERIELGSVAGVHSNVRSNAAVPELLLSDESRHFLLQKSRLFRADADAKLPTPESQLTFKFASLSASIDGIYSPARNINPEVFISSGCIFDKGQANTPFFDRIPAAVQIVCSMRTVLGEKRDYHGILQFVSTAASNGAASGPD